jgi:hypothetical protein
MLTNLDFLKTGEPFPPKGETARMKMYKENRALFEGEHAEVYRENLKRIERVIGNFGDVISYPVVVNFQKLLSLKIADLLLGEPPIISAKTDAQHAALDTISDNSELPTTAYQIAIDVSRYGNGLFYVRKQGDKGIIDLTQPPVWFPVVAENNVREFQYHVLAWESGDQLRCQIHSRGFYEERYYNFERGMIGTLRSSTDRIQTGLDDFAIIPVSNVQTSDRVTGLDDYTDLDSLISDLMVRLGQIDRILDKHANPSVSGPQAALERDERSHEWRLKLGNYFPRDSKDDPPVEYVTWDGELAANFAQVEKIINLIYTISEMGSALFGDMTSGTGQVPSGSALRRLMISPLAKVSRIRARFDPAMKKALALCSQLGGPRVEFKDISINWQDGLPPDFTEDAAIMKSRTADKATMSQHRALVMFDGLTEEEADAELARIQDEEAAQAPLTPPPFSRGPESEPVDEDEDEEAAGAAPEATDGE